MDARFRQSGTALGREDVCSLGVATTVVQVGEERCSAQTILAVPRTSTYLATEVTACPPLDLDPGLNLAEAWIEVLINQGTTSPGAPVPLRIPSTRSFWYECLGCSMIVLIALLAP